MRNEEVFSLLRFVLTGNPVGPPVGEIMDVLGRKTTVRRMMFMLEKELN